MAALVTNAGFANLAAAWNAYTSRPVYLQWGVGTGQAATDNTVADTTGTTEARTSGSSSVVTTTVTNDTYQVTGTITAIGTPTITEVGLFDAAGSGGPPTGGNMDVYGSFTGVALGVGDSIAFTVKVKMT